MFGSPALKALQEAPPFVRSEDADVRRREELARVAGRRDEGRHRDVGDLPETFVQVSPASVVTKTCREGVPR